MAVDTGQRTNRTHWRSMPVRSLATATGAPSLTTIAAALSTAIPAGSADLSVQHSYWLIRRGLHSTSKLRFCVGHGSDANQKYGQILLIGISREAEPNTPYAASYRGSFSIQGGNLAVNALSRLNPASPPTSFKWVDYVSQIDNGGLSPGVRLIGQSPASPPIALSQNGITEVHLDPTGDEYLAVVPWCAVHGDESGTACTHIGCQYAEVG